METLNIESVHLPFKDLNEGPQLQWPVAMMVSSMPGYEDNSPLDGHITLRRCIHPCIQETEIQKKITKSWSAHFQAV